MSTVTDVVEIPVSGMTCGHCVGAVKAALEGVTGVVSASVDLDRGRAAVTLDPALADRAGLKAAIESAGYTVPEFRPPPSLRLVTVSGLPVGGLPPLPFVEVAPAETGPPVPEAEEWNLAVGGMHCASCVARVEGALARVPGVREARVNLATERASVVVDPARVDEADLARSVASAGYSVRRAELTPGEGAAALRRERAEQVAAWRNRLVVGVVLTVPLVVLGYAPLHALGVHTAVGWFMLPLATVLQVYLGGPYVVGAWHRLKQGSSNMDTLIALGTSTAYGYSLYQLLAGDPQQAQSRMRWVGVAVFLSVALGPIVVDEVRTRCRPRTD